MDYFDSLGAKQERDSGEVYMSNLGQAIEEKGIAIGEARIILNMYKNGLTAEQIAAVSDKDIREIEAIVETVI